METLGREVSAQLAAWPTAEADLRAARGRLMANASPRRRTSGAPRKFALALIGAGALAGGITMLVLRAPLTAVIEGTGHAPVLGVPIVAMGAETTVAFSEGTRVALAPGAAAQVDKIASNGADLRILRGHATVAVTPRAARTWHLRAGPFTVRVTGTRFGLAWNPSDQQVVLNMQEGSVVISGGCLPPEGRRLSGTESLSLSCRPVAKPTAQLVSAPAHPRPTERPAALEPARVRTAGADTPPWKILFESGRYSDAHAAAVTAGFDREASLRSGADVIMLGDAARLAGAQHKATQAYQTVRKRFAGQPVAAQAAYVLGRLHSDDKNFAQAAKWFALYLKEDPHGPLGEEASGRLMDAHNHTGNLAEARRLAQDYLRRHPEGGYKELARSLVIMP